MSWGLSSSSPANPRVESNLGVWPFPQLWRPPAPVSGIPMVMGMPSVPLMGAGPMYVVLNPPQAAVPFPGYMVPVLPRKRGRGRPPGSKDKQKRKRRVASSDPSDEGKRRRRDPSDAGSPLDHAEEEAGPSSAPGGGGQDAAARAPGGLLGAQTFASAILQPQPQSHPRPASAGGNSASPEDLALPQGHGEGMGAAAGMMPLGVAMHPPQPQQRIYVPIPQHPRVSGMP